MNAIKKCMSHVKNAMKLTDIVIDVVLFAALLPLIQAQINSAKTNLTATEQAVISVAIIFLVIALIVAIAKQTGLINKK